MRSSDLSAPLVSVVIPVYNRETTVGRAVVSVLNQSYTNLELIIVDDCSNDNSLQVVREFQDKRIKVIASEQNSGANAARNKGILAAKGQYVAFQDSDDEWVKDKLKIQLQDMIDRGLSASFCAHRLIDGRSERIVPDDYEDKKKYETELMNVLAHCNVVSTQTLIVKRNVFDKIGYFDEEMPRLQDYEFVIRLAQKEKIGYIACPLVLVYHSQISISTNLEALREAVILLLIKNGDFVNKQSMVSLFLNNALLSGQGSQLYTECVRLQNMAAGKNIQDLNVLEYVLDCLVHKYGLCSHIQRKLYESQMENLKPGQFVIYGAGHIARKIYRELKDKRRYPKCFLVTRDKKEDMIDGIPVCIVDDWDDKDMTVVVGVAAVSQNEIIDILISRKYKHIICYPD